NGQLNDKERLYNGNDVCRIHSKTQQHCCLYQYDGYLLDYKDDDKDDHSLTEKWKSLIPLLTALCTWREESRE
ncbi:MAG: hypothetical protein ACI4D9_13455, partial [Lachnospiraceae bacterium]